MEQKRENFKELKKKRNRRLKATTTWTQKNFLSLELKLESKGIDREISFHVNFRFLYSET